MTDENKFNEYDFQSFDHAAFLTLHAARRMTYVARFRDYHLGALEQNISIFDESEHVKQLLNLSKDSGVIGGLMDSGNKSTSLHSPIQDYFIKRIKNAQTPEDAECYADWLIEVTYQKKITVLQDDDGVESSASKVQNAFIGMLTKAKTPEDKKRYAERVLTVTSNDVVAGKISKTAEYARYVLNGQAALITEFKQATDPKDIAYYNKAMRALHSHKNVIQNMPAETRQSLAQNVVTAYIERAKDPEQADLKKQCLGDLNKIINNGDLFTNLTNEARQNIYLQHDAIITENLNAAEAPEDIMFYAAMLSSAKIYTSDNDNDSTLKISLARYHALQAIRDKVTAPEQQATLQKLIDDNFKVARDASRFAAIDDETCRVLKWTDVRYLLSIKQTPNSHEIKDIADNYKRVTQHTSVGLKQEIGVSVAAQFTQNNADIAQALQSTIETIYAEQGTSQYLKEFQENNLKPLQQRRALLETLQALFPVPNAASLTTQLA